MQPLDYIRQEWSVLKNAPGVFIGLAVVFFIAGVGLTRWYDADKLSDKDDQLRRYRVALGIEPGSPNALVELTNSELKSKTLLVASQVRDLCDSFNKQSRDIKAQLDTKKTDRNGADQQQEALRKDISTRFHNEVRSDALNVHNELLKRLDSKAVAAVVRYPIFSDAKTGTPVSLYSLLPSQFGFDAMFLCDFGGELEQLAKLLPPR